MNLNDRLVDFDARRLAGAFRANGRSVSEVAKATGVAQTALNGMTQGKQSTTRLSSLTRIATALHTSSDYLRGRGEDYSPSYECWRRG